MAKGRKVKKKAAESAVDVDNVFLSSASELVGASGLVGAIARRLGSLPFRILHAESKGRYAVASRRYAAYWSAGLSLTVLPQTGCRHDHSQRKGLALALQHGTPHGRDVCSLLRPTR